jgi:Domain of unknown function (DUF4357)
MMQLARPELRVVAKAMPGFSISIFLPDGDPRGRRVATRSHWTGEAVMVSRAQYPEVASDPRFQRTGVYVLTGPSEDPSRTARVYIGQGDVVRSRINSHLANKDFWTDVLVFTKTDESLDKADATQLEARLVGLAKEAQRAELDNANEPSPPALASAKEADVQSFLEDMLPIFRVLGIDAFETSIPSGDLVGPAVANSSAILSFNLSGGIGHGYQTTDGFVVLKGARAKKTEAPTIPRNARRLREELVSSNVLLEVGGTYELQRDYRFSSSSAAAGVLAGCSTSGPAFWKDEHGRSLAELQVAQAKVASGPDVNDAADSMAGSESSPETAAGGS